MLSLKFGRVFPAVILEVSGNVTKLLQLRMDLIKRENTFS